MRTGVSKDYHYLIPIILLSHYHFHHHHASFSYRPPLSASTSKPNCLISPYLIKGVEILFTYSLKMHHPAVDKLNFQHTILTARDKPIFPKIDLFTLRPIYNVQNTSCYTSAPLLKPVLFLRYQTLQEPFFLTNLPRFHGSTPLSKPMFLRPQTPRRTLRRTAPIENQDQIGVSLAVRVSSPNTLVEPRVVRRGGKKVELLS